LSAQTERRPAWPFPIAVTIAVIAVVMVSWTVSYVRMQGMDMGPGTDPGDVGWFLGLWVTMMAAMMLPSVAPMVLVFSRISRERARRQQAFVPTWIFVSGYLIVWTAYGLVAFGLYRGIAALNLGFLSWQAEGPIVAGGAIVFAGVYQLTPLKRVCLRHCRTPLSFVLHKWREGRTGALLMGIEHGAYCVGCCVGLMLTLFALGVMSLVWMAVVAALIFAEKVLPMGEKFARGLSLVFAAVGVWVAIAPATLPGLA
jgi:predicted metal-binding membrane protein